MGRLLSLCSAVLFVSLVAAPAAAEKRVALVIGNSTYVNVPRLSNPANDAKLMADTLKALGFTLVGGKEQLDLDKAAIDRVVQAFGAQLQGADVGLFYYAGHGVQVRGANYLVPVGANPVKEADVDFQMLDTNLVLRQMESAGARLNVVILDACRNNPFGGRGLRSAGNGLAQMQAPEGTLISFATQPGNTALDGDDAHSPYTKALTQTIRRPGLGIFDAFNEVGLAVKRATNGAQQPWVSSSPIAGSFFFAGAPATPTPAIAASPASPIDPCAAAADHWRSAEGIGTLAVFEDHIARFPSCAFAGLARARIEALKTKTATILVPPIAPSRPTETLPKPAVPSGVTPLSAERERALGPKDTFKECDACPEMVVVPAGSFTMGSPEGEKGRSSNEGPEHLVTFSRQFAVGKLAVTVDQFAAFVKATGYDSGSVCSVRGDDGKWKERTDRSWRNPGLRQSGSDPAVCTSWDDANAYVEWLSRSTGRTYRILSEAEWEYVERARTTTPFWIGSSKWEWAEDCYHNSYAGAPADGTAWTSGDCRLRVRRWSYRSPERNYYPKQYRYDIIGFRIARTLTLFAGAAAAPVQSTPAPASLVPSEQKPKSTALLVDSLSGTVWNKFDSTRQGQPDRWHFKPDNIWFSDSEFHSITQQGTWKRDGTKIHIYFTSKFAEFWGTIEGTRMSGDARNQEGRTWTWTAELVRQ
jgi:formylglycine-generating enzyme required for sulfatase activity